MIRLLFGVFLILHGLVHLWYVTLSQRLVAFQPDMGWTGESWLLSGLLGEGLLRPIASLLFVVAAMAYLASGIGVLSQTNWWQPVLLGAAGISFITILAFWDGDPQMIVQKGLLGVLIDAALILFVLFNWG